MFAPHGFLYRRSPNGAHPDLAARLNPTSQGQPLNAPAASPAVDPSPTNSANALTPVAPTSKTSDSPTGSAASPTPSQPTPSSSSPSSLSSTSRTSSSSSSSSSTTATSTIASSVATPLTVASPTAANGPSLTTQVVAGVTFTPSSTLSSTLPSSSAGSSGTVNTGAIVGGVAGTLVGIAVLGFLLMWCMRRQRDRDFDDFDAQAFRRQSAVLVDDPIESSHPARPYNPRPPTMIERHNASPALAAQTGFGGQNIYGNYGGYGQHAPYPPPEMIQPAVSPPPQAYGAPPMSYTGYNEPQPQVVRQPSNAGYLTRQTSSTAGHVTTPGSFDPSTQYIDLNRSSISPYQAAQYADISRQLGSTEANADVHHPIELPHGPLPSPFDDPVSATLPQLDNATAQPQTHVAEPHQRPATIYEEGDAYSGI